MHIKKPFFVRKGERFFCEVMYVDMVCGNAVRVLEGHWWNVEGIVKVSSEQSPMLQEAEHSLHGEHSSYSENCVCL